MWHDMAFSLFVIPAQAGIQKQSTGFSVYTEMTAGAKN
jgi:hypothetical protein